ncbi:transposase family protein [Runella salmonicolor]|uniref:Transposase family protein n=1 Tax=Runella salmonicolor TaxID=2950278 RepID=A0ABT1FQX5_9BACT|nr:transposase family protein [Runella salmonicolor]MCP1384101.1 transposase family protein [Runella salmonicolor]
MPDFSPWRYCNLQNNESMLRRLTGLNRRQFESLHPFFENSLNDYFNEFTLEGTPRNRRPFVHGNAIFTDTRDSLLFILAYVNGNVRQAQLADFFGIDQPKVSKYIKILRPILSQAIKANPDSLSKYKKELLFNKIHK